MSSPPDSHGNGQGSSTTWTEPPWSGWIETTGDALLILEAARRGLIPRVTRRLVDSERKMITSGSVFVFDEDESGIKRWTDGFFWSPSRILGNFLLYRETEKRGAGHRGARNDAEQGGDQSSGDATKSEGQTLSRPRGETTRLGIDRQRERSLVGSLTNSYKFKSGGMMKKVCLIYFISNGISTCYYLFSFRATGRSIAHTPANIFQGCVFHGAWQRHHSRPQDVRSLWTVLAESDEVSLDVKAGLFDSGKIFDRAKRPL